ncbi:MAG: hypothetical protein R2724_09500 [Bryobacterales bacterium]
MDLDVGWIGPGGSGLAGGDFFLLLLGVSAMLVGLCVAIGVANPFWVQVALYCVFCWVTVFWLPANKLKALSCAEDGEEVDALVGRAVALQDLAEGALGRWSCAARPGTRATPGTAPDAGLRLPREARGWADALRRTGVGRRGKRAETGGDQIMEMGIIVLVVIAILIMVVVAKTAIVVPQQSVFVVERLGRYAGTLDAKGSTSWCRSST